MTDGDIRRIETALGVTLPASCGRTLRAFPSLGSGPGGLFNEADSVIGATQVPLPDGDYDGASWRPSYVALGFSAAGDVYLLETARDPAPVLVLSHEDHAVTEEAPSLAAFAAQWEREQAEADARARAVVEEDERRGRHRRRFLLALFTLLPLLLVILGLFVWALRPGLWPKGLLLIALAVAVALVRVMARAVRQGIHY